MNHCNTKVPQCSLAIATFISPSKVERGATRHARCPLLYTHQKHSHHESPKLNARRLGKSNLNQASQTLQRRSRTKCFLFYHTNTAVVRAWVNGLASQQRSEAAALHLQEREGGDGAHRQERHELENLFPVPVHGQ